nr:ABC transporter permease [Saccharopolyspora sp. HNM0983]
MAAVLDGPSAQHPLGTDELGRDVLARLAHGAPLTLGAAGAALLLSVLIGVFVGGLTGRSGGRIAVLVRGLIDVAVALPPVLVAIIAGLIGGPGRITLVFALVSVGWLPFARQVDAQVAAVRGEPWVRAHEALGASPVRVLRVSVLPAVLPAVGALAVVRLPALINTVAALGFLGLGPPPPSPEWGAMLAESVDHLETAPWLLLAPLLAVLAVQTLLAGTGRTDHRPT